MCTRMKDTNSSQISALKRRSNAALQSEGSPLERVEWIRRVPFLLLLAAGALLFIGINAIARGDELFRLGEFAPRQRVWAFVSVIGFAAAAAFPYQRLKPFALPIYGLSLGLLVAVFFTRPKNFSYRWIPLGFMDFQPSELAKIAFILALAAYLMKRPSLRHWYGLLIPFVMMALPAALILKEPDLGTSLLFAPTLMAMLFTAGARPRHLALVAVLGAMCVPVLWTHMSAEQKSRVVAVFRQKTGGDAPDDDGYHLHQAKRVLALGGVFGSSMSGMPVSNVRAYHLPESRTDFVFCLIGERWGFVGCSVVLGLIALLIGRGLFVAAQTREPFGRLIVVGIVTLLGTQAAINTSMTVGLLPITGMTLPLVSYGGSSLLTTSMSLGLIVNVALRPDDEVEGDPFEFAE